MSSKLERNPEPSNSQSEVTTTASQKDEDVTTNAANTPRSSNVYTPLLTGASGLSPSGTSIDLQPELHRLSVTISTETQPEPQHEPHRPKDVRVKHPARKSRYAVVPHASRGGQRSLVRPFFCCGSELSLVSLVDGLELKNGRRGSNSKLKSIEGTDSSSDEETSLEDSKQDEDLGATAPVASHSGMRRKKKDKRANKKKFWSLRLRGRWNTRWRVSQPQRHGRSDLSHHSSGSMSQGTYQATCSPGTSRRLFGGRVLLNLNRLYPTEDLSHILSRLQDHEIAQGVNVNQRVFSDALDIIPQRRRLESLNSPDGETPPQVDYSRIINNVMLQLQQQESRGVQSKQEGKPGSPRIYTQVDYIHCLVPKLVKIMNCPFYWGIMDKHEAERLLENKPEGTFLLRDSAQEEFLFSVSFRRYNRCLNARVEQWNHKFSFDAHDPCVYSAPSVSDLMEHYKSRDPSSCMFYEPMLTRPLPRNFTFSLQDLSRAVICDSVVYDQIHELPLPNGLKQFLQAYHYKQKVRVRHFDGSGVVYEDNEVCGCSSDQS